MTPSHKSGQRTTPKEQGKRTPTETEKKTSKAASIFTPTRDEVAEKKPRRDIERANYTEAYALEGETRDISSDEYSVSEYTPAENEDST